MILWQTWVCQSKHISYSITLIITLLNPFFSWLGLLSNWQMINYTLFQILMKDGLAYILHTVINDLKKRKKNSLSNLPLLCTDNIYIQVLQKFYCKNKNCRVQQATSRDNSPKTENWVIIYSSSWRKIGSCDCCFAWAKGTCSMRSQDCRLMK